MGTITFKDEICDESYAIFEQKVNEALEKEQDLTIYIATEGGEFCLSQCMVDMINNYPYYVEVIFAGYVFSAGMYMMTNLDYTLVDVNLMEATDGMVHLVDRSLSQRDMFNSNSYTRYVEKNKSIINDSYLKNIKRFLSEEEIKTIYEGLDVFLTHDRLSEIIETLSKEAEEKIMGELADE